MAHTDAFQPSPAGRGRRIDLSVRAGVNPMVSIEAVAHLVASQPVASTAVRERSHGMSHPKRRRARRRDATAAAGDRNGEVERPVAWQAPLSFASEVTSTMDVAARWTDAPEWSVVVADHQTVGTAGPDRAWWSRAGGSSLLISVVLRPPPSVSARPAIVNFAAVVGLFRALRALGYDPEICWPTTLLLGGRKVAGICSATHAAGSVLILGVGINCGQRADDFPEDLRPDATSLAAEGGRPFDRLTVLSHFLTSFHGLYDGVVAGDRKAVLDAYRRHCRTLGRDVRVDFVGPPSEGRAVGVAADCRLVLDTGVRVSAGRVTEIPPAPSPSPRSAGAQAKRLGPPLIGLSVLSASGLIGREVLRRSIVPGRRPA